MNANNCVGFAKCGEFLKAVNDWKYWGGECTYMLVSSQPMPHPNGGYSDILFIGYTQNLGGNANSLLWNYCNQTTPQTEKRIIQWINKNQTGSKVFLYLCPISPSGASVQQYAKDLLNQYEAHYKHLPLLRLKR